VTVELARAGGPIAGLGLAILIAAPLRWQRLAGLAAGGVAGACLAVALAWAFARWPLALPVAALAAAPARIPVHFGSSGVSNLLLPLYAVIAGAALLLAWQLVRGDTRARELGPVTFPLAGIVAWMGISLAWSVDVNQGALELLAFVLPFGLLAVALARIEWSPLLARVLAVELVALALECAVVGIYQYESRKIFWNPKVSVGNVYQPFFRVNSLFWDPSVYGRFLVLAILVCVVAVLFGAERRFAQAAAVAIVPIWLGLLFSFSQSSFFALIVGVLVAGALVWGRRVVGAFVLVGLVLVAVGFAVPSLRHTLVTRWHHAANDRKGLVVHGVGIWTDHPVVGVGVGGFKQAFAEREHIKGKEPKKAASHDTPVTVAAEVGTPGLALLAWLLGAALAAGLAAPRTDARSRMRLAGGIVFAAIFAHSLFYNDFFEDPLMWGALALVAVAGSARLRA
jgi:putative inorganic carbon (HCO3(-)) transporter